MAIVKSLTYETVVCLALKPVALCYLFLLSYHAHSQPAFARFTNYSAKEGLANNLVNDLIRDSFGFMWAYTPGGISRFDGIEFKTYPFPYYGYDRNNFAVDAQGNLWATDGIDLYFLNRKTDRFEQFTLARQSHRGLAFIHSNRQDKETWFREGSDLYKIESSKRIVRVTKKVLPGTDQSFNYRDKKGRFWFGAPGQIQIYFPESDSIVQIPFESNNWAHRFIEDDDDERIWVSIGGSGLILIDLQSNLIQSYRKKDAPNNYYDLVLLPALSGDSILWTNGKFYEGIQLFSKKQKRFVGNYLHTPLNEQSLIDNLTYKLYLDQEGVLWAGTAGGFCSLHPRRQDAIRYLLPDHSASMTPRAIYRSRHRTVDDAIVFFNPHELLYFYQGKARSLISNNLGLWSKTFGTIFGCYDLTGRLWVGTATGLHRIDRGRGRVSESFIISASGNAMIGPMIPDRSGNIWFEADRRLVRWNMSNKKMAYFQVVPGDPEHFQPNDFLIAKVFDRKDMLWLCTSLEIILFNPETGRIVRRYAFPGLPPLNRRPAEIKDFNLDNRGNIWLGLNTGLVKVDSLTGQYRLLFFPGNDTSTNGQLTNLLIDDRGNVWSATYSGIYCYSPDAERFVHLDEKKDLSSNIVYDIGWVGDRIYAYHANGRMDVIDPALTLKPLPVPPLYISAIRISDRTIPYDWAETDPRPVHLSYRDNIISFLYTAVDFAAPQKITYQYRLDGFDDSWHDGGTRREATYTNLGGGHYAFRVRAINGDGVISPREAVMKIYVQPPYWDTWWFRSMLALAFITIVYTIFRYRELQRLGQEKLRLRIARDLHDEMGSTLSSISILSEVALRNLQADIDRTRFGAIGDRARQVMEAMSDIVWSVNPRNDSMENVLQRMKGFAVELLDPQGITLHFELDEAVEALNLPMDKRKDFYLLFKEAMNNVAKYSLASDVWVQLRSDNGALHLEVRDNGRGFDPVQVKLGNGIWNMKKRAEQMKAVFILTSVAGEGTRVEVIL